MLYKFFLILLFVHSFFEAKDDFFCKTLSSWSKQFDNLPKNREGASAFFHSGFASCGSKIKQWQEFEKVLQAWLTMNAQDSLSHSKKWLHYKPLQDFFDIQRSVSFQPFAQKLVLKSGDIVYVRGDLHGDIFSLLGQLNNLYEQGVIDDCFKIIQPNVWILFLGDYVDRGQYGCEVLYTMMRLSLANPNKVLYVRGNHEDIKMSICYGFKKEVDQKFEDPEGIKHNLISRMYDFMPVVCYVGCQNQNGVTNYLQCCHGGIEIGYDPKMFLDSDKQYHLLGSLQRKTACQNLLQLCNDYEGELQNLEKHMQDNLIFASPRSHNLLGFMWTDFDVLNIHQVVFNHLRKAGFMYGKNITQDILTMQSSSKSKVRGILRAHQHDSCLNDMMQGLIASNGIYSLWNQYENDKTRFFVPGLVWTFNVGPDSVYGSGAGFNFDAYAKIIVQQNYEQWFMQVLNNFVIQEQHD